MSARWKKRLVADKQYRRARSRSPVRWPSWKASGVAEIERHLRGVDHRAGFFATKFRLMPSFGWIWITSVLGRHVRDVAVAEHGSSAIGLNWMMISVSRAAIALPVRRLERTRQPLVMAMGQGVGSKRPTRRNCARWAGTILEAGEALPDHRSYHEFLRTSKAEWSVAKHGYVAARTGWFSCRTACYLALGRPAVVQETGWSKPPSRGHRGARLQLRWRKPSQPSPT